MFILFYLYWGKSKAKVNINEDIDIYFPFLSMFESLIQMNIEAFVKTYFLLLLFNCKAYIHTYLSCLETFIKYH